MARSKDTVLALGEAVAYLRKPRPVAHKLAEESTILGQEFGRRRQSHNTAIANRLGQRARKNRWK